MKLLIHTQTSTVQPLKIGNEYVISSHTLSGMWLLIHAGIKVNHVSKRCPWCLNYIWNNLDGQLKQAGGRLNKKDGLTRYGNSHVKDKTS